MRKIILLLAVAVIAGEALCRLWNAHDAWQRYNRLLLETTIVRDQVYTLSKPSNTKRIILVGGSAAYDTVDDYRKSWPYKVQQILQPRFKERIEVLNFGFYTQPSTDEIFHLDSAVNRNMKPDLVIVFDGFNDVYNFWHHYDYWKRLYEVKAQPILNEKKRPEALKFFYTLARKIRDESALTGRLKQFVQWLKRRISLKALEFKREENKKSFGVQSLPVSSIQSTAQKEDAPAPVPQDPFADVGKGPSEDQFFEDRERWPEIKAGYIEMYGTNLTKMARLIKREKAKGLYIFQPDLSYKPLLTEKISIQEKEQYLSGISKHAQVWREIQEMAYPHGLRLMREIAEKFDLNFADFNEKILLKEDVSALFTGNVHFSDEGRDMIAREVSELILKYKLLE